MIRTGRAAVAAFLMAATPLMAQTTPPESEDIVVLGAGEHGYKLSAEQLRNAVRAFEQYRSQFSPSAQLVWHIIPKRSDVGLALRNGDERLPIAIAPDGTFTLPHDRLLTGQWHLVSSASKTTIHIHPRAQSPGATATRFRFGDAQLTCRVMWGFRSSDFNFVERGLFNAVGGCTSSRLGIYFASPKPIAAVSIDHWSGKPTIAKDGMAWRLPMYDKHIGNDDLVHITYRQP